MGTLENLTGQKFNHWTIIEELGGGKVLCECDCENHTRKELYKKAIKSGKTKSCGCASGRRQLGDITGQQFGNWVVLQDLGGGKVLCQCQCENKTVRELYKKAVVNRQTKSCGCMRGQNCNETKQQKQTDSPNSKYIGTTVKGWTAKSKNGNKLVCEDYNGNTREFYISHFSRGGIQEAGTTKLNDLTGQKINHWTVLEELGDGKIMCQCDCAKKTTKVVYKSSLLNGKSKSCGCASAENCKETMMKRYGDVCTLKIDNPRDKNLIDILNNKDKFIEYLDKFDDKPYIDDIIKDLQVNKSSVLRSIHKFECEDKVKFLYGESYFDRDAAEYVRSLGLKVDVHRYDLIKPYELDIYIPDKKIAIECNGSYWHSDIYKDNKYHQLKSLMCKDIGIRLIHIFEYEWTKNKTNIQNFLRNTLVDNDKVYARNCNVTEISNEAAISFCNKYHLQGGISSDINIGLLYNNEIIGVMTFSIPRFDKSCQYELIRMCFGNTKVYGGASKMLSYFIHKYNVASIVTYCDFSKFGGDTYEKLGFKLCNITEPSYVWTDGHGRVLSRYQTQKQKLIKAGLGNESQTEKEIMQSLNMFKIYNSGNLKYVWNKEDNK